MIDTLPVRLRQAAQYVWQGELYDLMIEAAAALGKSHKPLEDDKAVEGFCSIPHPTHYLQAFIAGVRFAESEHGIKD